jgi:hypothetical protein
MKPPATNMQPASDAAPRNPCQPGWKRQRGDAAVKAAYLLEMAHG